MEKEIILSLDIFGTAIFAATGAIKGVRRRLDIFGVTVLACCVGVGGGITRDAILGAVPAAALQNWSYLGVSIAVALIIFFSVRLACDLASLSCQYSLIDFPPMIAASCFIFTLTSDFSTFRIETSVSVFRWAVVCESFFIFIIIFSF